MFVTYPEAAVGKHGTFAVKEFASNRSKLVGITASRAGYPMPMIADLVESLFDPIPVNSWRTLGQCSGLSNLFFAPPAERPQTRFRREQAARALCATCPVKSVCRDYARSNHEYGVWGGENEEERVRSGAHLSAPLGVRRARATKDELAIGAHAS